MLMSFEGWQLRVIICDRSEEVEDGRDLPGVVNSNPQNCMRRACTVLWALW
jgi:hypothetical protein